MLNNTTDLLTEENMFLEEEGSESSSVMVDEMTTTTTMASPTQVQHPPWLGDMEMIIRTYLIPILCAVGILFNSTSVAVLFHSELQLRKQLIHLFAFLNSFDW